MSTINYYFLLAFLQCYSQKNAITFYDDFWQLTPKNFGKYFRIGVLDTVKYQYYGEVKDHYLTGKLQMKGTFKANIKVDTFYFYFTSGKLKTKGAYQNNVRYGIWTNYYENGKIKDKLAFNDDFLGVLEHYDENGNPRLIKGTGLWETEYIDDRLNELITLKGAFKDTLRHGTWTFSKKSLVKGAPKNAKKEECTEEYDNGKFVKGKYHWSGRVEVLKGPVMRVLPESIKFANMENWNYSKYASIKDYPFLWFLPMENSTVPPVDQIAQFPRGTEGLTQVFKENINLPQEYIATQKTRSAAFHILVNENGKAIITQDFSKGNLPLYPTNQVYYEQVIKTIQQLPAWEPATLNGKKVKNYFSLSVIMDNGKVSVLLKSHNARRIGTNQPNYLLLLQQK